MKDDDTIYLARLHWVLFFWPTVLALLSIYLGYKFPGFRGLFVFFFAFFLVWVLITWITYHFSSLTIKKKRVILCTGLLVRKTTDIPLSKIETIDIRQSLLGSLLRYGTLIITGTGGTRHGINFLEKPLTCRRYIEQLMHEES